MHLFRDGLAIGDSAHGLASRAWQGLEFQSPGDIDKTGSVAAVLKWCCASDKDLYCQYCTTSQAAGFARLVTGRCECLSSSVCTVICALERWCVRDKGCATGLACYRSWWIWRRKIGCIAWSRVQSHCATQEWEITLCRSRVAEQACSVIEKSSPLEARLRLDAIFQLFLLVDAIFAGWGNFPNLWLIFSIFNFFFEMLFLHLLLLVFPRTKHVKMPRKYTSFTAQFGSTHMRWSADFEKKCVFKS